ncbi:MAG: hypothetical protein MI861_20095, partial [Pirellulales bacterium]|nr:hypothetical protein [Pirellulales bacterium]
MDKRDVKSICPACNSEIDVDEILSKQYEDEYKKKLSEEVKKYEAEKSKLDQEREAFSKEREELQKTISDSVEERRKAEKAGKEE